jgi:hypothetical protein
MHIDLTPWLILWGLIASVVLVLALWRLTVVWKEKQLGPLHIAGSDVTIDQELRIAHTLLRIDFWGKALTVAAAVLITAILAVAIYEGWVKANGVLFY